MSGRDTVAGAARHEWNNALCTRLEKIIIGRHAAELLDGQRADLKDPAVATLGAWSWLRADIKIGRKGLRRDGRAMLMPVRVTWSVPSVLVLGSGMQVAAAWKLLGLGHEATGTLTVTNDAGTIVLTGDVPPELAIATLSCTPRTVRREMAELVRAGETARWDAIMSLEGYVERAVHNAITRVSVDILAEEYDRVAVPVLDVTAQERVRDTLLLGSPGSEDGGFVQRILERCMGERTFVKVEPLKYVVTDLHRSAEAEVRRAIDDPYIGRKIRRVHRELPGASLEEVIAVYRERHPGDALSTKRAMRALTSTRDPMAGVADIDSAGANGAADFNLEDFVLSYLEPGVVAA